MANGVCSTLTHRAWLPSCSFHLISHFLSMSFSADISHGIKSLGSNLYRIVLWFMSVCIYCIFYVRIYLNWSENCVTRRIGNEAYANERYRNENRVEKNTTETQIGRKRHKEYKIIYANCIIVLNYIGTTYLLWFARNFVVILMLCMYFLLYQFTLLYILCAV